MYLALDERLVSGSGKDTAPSHCSVETELQSRIVEVLDEVESSLVARLKESTIADVHPNSCSYCGN